LPFAVGIATAGLVAVGVARRLGGAIELAIDTVAVQVTVGPLPTLRTAIGFVGRALEVAVLADAR
jgi:hypothetical protein